MRRVLLAVVVAASLAATIAAASPFIDFTDATDYAVAPSPCGSIATLQASPVVFDERLYLSYLCADNRVFMRQFALVNPPYGAMPPSKPYAPFQLPRVNESLRWYSAMVVTEIGGVVAGEGARFLTADGKPLVFARPSFSHF